MDKKKKLKIDPVLLAAWLLAAVSAFFVHLDNDYLSYIDFRSLGILWSLMVIIQGLKENSVFERIAEKLLAKVKGFRQLVLVLVFLCFFSAMLITNDVALITFVPFSIMILINCSKKDAIMVPLLSRGPQGMPFSSAKAFARVSSGRVSKSIPVHSLMASIIVRRRKTLPISKTRSMPPLISLFM